MPIEIKELHIRVAVNASQEVQGAGKLPTADGTSSASGDNSAAKNAIIAECVEQILHILQQKLER